MNLVNCLGSVKNKFAFSDHSFMCRAAARWRDRNLEIFLTSHIDFLFVFGQYGDNLNKICFWKET